MDERQILFFGDPHGDFTPILRAAERHAPEAIVLLGDLQARRPLDVELASIRDQTDIWFIHGNHDTDSDEDYDNLWRSHLADRNLHGRVVEVAGHRIAGLGGVFRQRVWDPALPRGQAGFQSPKDLHERTVNRRQTREIWRGGFLRKHHSSIFPSDYERLLGLHADILVTHEAPGEHQHGFIAIDELATALGVRLLVHGHHHEDVDYAAQGLGSAPASMQIFGVNQGSWLALDRNGNAHLERDVR
jgi:predicted phosphodiesterase